MIQRMRSNLWIIAVHATLIPFVFFFYLLSWSIGAALPAFYAATWIAGACTLVGLAAIVLDGVCYHYGIGERMHAFFDRCEHKPHCGPDCGYLLGLGDCRIGEDTWGESEVSS
jgi:hypothetical protein